MKIKVLIARFLKVLVSGISYVKIIMTKLFKREEDRYIAGTISSKFDSMYDGKITVYDKANNKYLKKNGVIHFFNTLDEAKMVAMSLNKKKQEG